MLSCNDCPAKPKCTKLCKKMEKIVNGKSPRKESLATPSMLSHFPQSDYNDVLHELMINAEARDIERLEAIREVEDMRRRVIMAAILVGVPQLFLSQFCNISQPLISQIYRGNR